MFRPVGTALVLACLLWWAPPAVARAMAGVTAVAADGAAAETAAEDGGAAGSCAGRVFSVGVEALQYLPHFAYDEQDREYQGFARQLLDAYAASRGCRFDYRVFPVKRLFDEYLSRRSLDFKYPDHPTWAAEAKAGMGIAYSAPVVSYIGGTMVLPENLGRGVDAVGRLGTVRGFTPWPWLERIRSGQVRVQETNKFTSLLLMTMKGRVDGADIDVAVARHHLVETFGMPGALVFDPGLPHVKNSYHLSSFKHPEVIKDFNAFLEEEAALVETIKARWKVEALE